MFREIILPILLSIVLCIFAFYLDYLHNKYPHLFRQKPKALPAGGKKLKKKKNCTFKIRTEKRAVKKKFSPKTRVSDPKAGDKNKKKNAANTSCPRCPMSKREMMGVLDIIAQDAYGTLFRCPECKKLYNFETAGGPFREVDKEWARQTWPNLEL